MRQDILHNLGQASSDDAFFAFSFCNLLCDSLSCSDVVKDPSAFLLYDWMGSLVWPEAAKELQQVWWTSACIIHNSMQEHVDQFDTAWQSASSTLSPTWLHHGYLGGAMPARDRPMRRPSPSSWWEGCLLCAMRFVSRCSC